LIILCSFSINIQTASSEIDYRTTEIERMVDFLTEAQFNESIGLCRDSPNVAPNTYWLVSDNLWALKALTLASQSNLQNSERAGLVAGKIEASLKEFAATYGDSIPVSSSGLPKSYCHEVVLGEVVSLPYRAANSIQLNNGSSYVLNVTVCDGAAMDDWENYTDRLLVGALSYHWQSDDALALTNFHKAVNTWNQTAHGLQDIATTSLYAVYKLALLLYTSRILCQELPFEQSLINRIYLQQEQDNKKVGFGGIITDYTATGTAAGDTNTETTSIVLIALLTPRAEVIPEQPSVLIAGLLVASAVVAVLTLKRPFKHFSGGVNR